MTKVYFLWAGQKWWVKEQDGEDFWTTRWEEDAATMSFQSSLKVATKLRKDGLKPIITWLPRPDPSLRAMNKAQELT